MSAQQALVRVTGKPSSGFPGKGAGALACCSCRRRCCCPCSRCSSCCSTGLEGADQGQRVRGCRRLIAAHRIERASGCMRPAGARSDQQPGISPAWSLQLPNITGCHGAGHKGQQQRGPQEGAGGGHKQPPATKPARRQGSHG